MLNNYSKALLTLVAGLFLCLTISSCEQNKQASVSNSNKILKRGNGPDPESLDPQLARSESALTLVRDLYEGLLTRNAKGELVSGVAQRWAFNQDDQCYRFYLRQDAKWSNGDVVVAQDFIRGMRFAINTNNNSPFSQLLTPIHNVDEILKGKLPLDALDVWAETPSELNVCMQGVSPAYALGLFALPVSYPRHAIDPSLSNGAYSLKERVASSHIRLIRNQHYHSNENSYFDEVVYISTEDANSELKRYLANDLDITVTIPSQDVKRLKASHPREIKVAPVLNTYFYGFNMSRAPFKDQLNLRRALSLAIDREVLADQVLGNGEKPTWRLVPPGIGGIRDFQPEDSLLSKTERIALAKKLYQESGYTKQNPLEFELRYNTSTIHKKIAVALSAMWKQSLGVEVELYNEEWKVFIQSRRQKQTQMFRSGWIADFNDASNYLELFTSNHSLNDYAYSNPRYDQLLQESSIATSKRSSILRSAEEMLLNDYAIIPLYTYVSKHLIHADIQGWEDNVLDIHLSQYLYK